MEQASRTGWPAVLAAGLLCAVVALALQAAGALDRAERATQDARFAVRGTQDPPREVLVVAIDDETIREQGGFPFGRSAYGKAIDRLTADGAAAIGVDVQFDVPSEDPGEDRALLDAAERSGRVVLGTTVATLDEEGRPRPAVFADPDELDARGVLLGDASFEVPDGTYRRVPAEVDGVPHLDVVLAEVARDGVPVDRGPLEGRGGFIDFAGPSGTVPTVSFTDLVEGRVPPAAIDGRVALIGVTPPSFNDVHPTPTADAMPGVEIHANAVASILGDRLLRLPPGWVTALLTLAAGIVPLAGVRARRAWAVPALAAAGVVALLAAAQALFGAGVLLEVVAPGVALALATLTGVVLLAVEEARGRARVRATFERFVPAGVVDEVLASAGDDLRLGGVRRDGTVVFCDLRGFTTWAEDVDAAEVIEVLNRYLEQMSSAIEAHGGTVVSYLGDGIMAVFGAPLAQEDHADRALAAALELAGPRLDAFNAAHDGPPFALGVGLHSGPVMSGNVGSARRVEYAAVGDTTNLASRVQGLTRETGHAVLLTEQTRAALRASPGAELDDLGVRPVRGRAQPVHLWGAEVGTGG